MPDQSPEYVAVLGGTGFAGRFIVRRLLQAGYFVHVYSRHPYAVPLAHPRAATFVLDIRLEKQLVGRAHYDAIVNATGRVAGVGYNSRHQAEMLAENFALMKNAADLAALQADYFVQLSSACVYASSVSAGARETDGDTDLPDAANLGYGMGKRLGEHYTRLKMAEMQTAFAILRPFNLYGPEDTFDEHAHVIPALIKRFVHEPEVQVWGDGSQVREFLYVEDLAEAVATVIGTRFAGTMNVCRGKEAAITIRELVFLIENILLTGKDVQFGESGPTGQLERYGDPTIIKKLACLPQTAFAEGLRKTIAWYTGQRQREPRATPTGLFEKHEVTDEMAK